VPDRTTIIVTIIERPWHLSLTVSAFALAPYEAIERCRTSLDSRIEIQVLKKRIVEALETFTIEELRRLVADIEERLRESE
jgi:hypothetical protein